MKKLLLKFLDSKFVNYLVTRVFPWIRFTTWYADVNGIQFNIMYKALRKGDFILVVDKYKLSTLLIPGTWSHVAIYVGASMAYEVAEMTHSGFTRSTFFDLCKTSDRVMIMRCRQNSDGYGDTIASEAMKYDGVPYDSTFTMGIKALYCSELCYLADIEKRAKFDLTDLANLGRPYLSPDGVAKAEGLMLVFDSDWIKKP